MSVLLKTRTTLLKTKRKSLKTGINQQRIMYKTPLKMWLKLPKTERKTW